MRSLTFHMPRRIDDVDPTVRALTSELEGYLSGEARLRFEITVSEALSNLVIHAKPATADATIDIHLALAADQVVVEIFDPEGAEPFDIKAHARDLSQIDLMAEHGRGLGIIIECADAVDYGSHADRNRLRLTFIARE